MQKIYKCRIPVYQFSQTKLVMPSAHKNDAVLQLQGHCFKVRPLSALQCAVYLRSSSYL